MDRLRSYRFLGGVLRVLHERSEAGGGLQHGESVDNADMRLPACRDGAVARSCQVRASAGGSLSTGRGCWMRGRSRRGGACARCGEGTGERGGCGRCCNAVNGRMGVVELH